MTQYNASINGDYDRDHNGRHQDNETGPDTHPHKHGNEEGHSHEKHDHHDHEDETGNKETLKKLLTATFVSTFFIFAQLTGGLLANSIAIMLDTAHLATDVLGFAIAIMAIKLAERKAVHTMTFGYHRAEIIGTILSLAFLWGITIWLLFAAYARLLNPPEI